MSKYLPLILTSVLALMGCSDGFSSDGLAKAKAAAGAAGMGSAGSDSAGKAGMSGKGGSAGAEVGGSAGNTVAGSAGKEPVAGTGGTDTAGSAGEAGMGEGGSGDTAGVGGSTGGTDTGVGGSTGGTDTGVGGSIAGMGGSSAGAGGSSAGVGSTGGTSVGGSTGGSDMGGTGGSMAGAGGSTGGSSAGVGGSSAGTGGSSAGTGGSAAGTGGTGPACTVGAVCRTATSAECDVPEYFDANCNCPSDNHVANGTLCGSGPTNDCTAHDACSAGACVHKYVAPGTKCGAGDDNSNCRTNLCDGSGSCNQVPAFGGEVCRGAMCEDGIAMGSAMCDGSTMACPASVANECNGPCGDGKKCAYSTAQKIEDEYSMLTLDNDESNLYASVRTSTGMTQIIRFSKDITSNKTVLYQTGNVVYALIAAGNSIYFSETADQVTGDVRRINKTGANQNPDVFSSQAAFGFAKNSTKVFWSDMSQNGCNCSSPTAHHIYSVMIDGTTANLVPNMTLGEISTDIEADDNYIYVWSMFRNGATASGMYSASMKRYLISNPLTNDTVINGSFTTDKEYYLLGTSSAMPGITKSGSAIFGNANISSSGAALAVGSNNAIFKVAASTNLLTQMSPVGLTRNFAADSVNLYIDNMRMPVNGGSMTYYVAHTFANTAFTIDSSTAFFGSNGYWTGLPPFSSSPDVQVSALYSTAL